jgi:NAD-dependent dihydropyrimidine dehydrogenase PreA subunit
MPHVITDTCTKDELCVEACPTGSIHPQKGEDGFDEASQLFVNPAECIDCGACVPVCPTGAIMAEEEMPAESAHFTELNAAHYN